MKHKRSLADWRSVRVWESDTRHHLRRKHALWFHGWCIGAIVLVCMWATAHLQLVMGSDSLALRYLITLGVGYLAFLLVLRWWAGLLVGESSGLDQVDPGNAADLGVDLASNAGDAAGPAMRSGGGGDFGGGGAEASFSDGADIGSVAGDVAGGALEAAGSADEGAVVLVPVVAVFLIGCAVVLGGGWLMLLYFGWDVLLTVAVELAFGYVSARTAVRVAREGWLSAAVRLTWKPLLGALACAVLLGALIDHFLPAAQSLPEAIRLLRR
ncbi:hypothetical protein FN976_11755 [Caenimonas sedimenti]|uniref:Transmembrane protein n=1 Tax=Caenimonas sedimenti TaxID=2596921 RepID=A0A562ZRS4_9BURK|nr:hypothetical protein [Caenimonas sedimenti]TWO70995.1 hypothetical protein FN976_11755 [Caenimonas sedimenti]